MKHAQPTLYLTAALSIALSAGVLPHVACAAERSEQRARIVESSLKDLTASNDAAIARQRIEPSREADALGNPRVALMPEQRVEADTLVRNDVQSSLHRLHRETVSRHTEDGRKARLDESLKRTVGDPEAP